MVYKDVGLYTRKHTELPTIFLLLIIKDKNIEKMLSEFAFFKHKNNV